MLRGNESCFHNISRKICTEIRPTLWMKSLAQWACAPKTPKTHPESKKSASFRFDTTYLDVLDALNHEKAMIHNPLIWFYNNFRNSWSILPKTKIGRKMSLQDGEVSYESIWNLLQKIIFTNHMSHQSSRLEREALVSITQKWKSSEIFLKICDFSETQNLPKGAPEIQNSRFRKDASHHCATIVYGSALKQTKHKNTLMYNFHISLFNIGIAFYIHTVWKQCP